jgi:hypothetical protein
VTPLRVWVKACAVVMLVSAITLLGHAAFLATLPDAVLEELGKAGIKADVADKASEVRLSPAGRAIGLDERSLRGLPSDQQIDAAFSDRMLRMKLREQNRDRLLSVAGSKTVGALLLLACSILILRRHPKAAGWLAWVLSLFGVIAIVSMVQGLAEIRGVSVYYRNDAFRIVEWLAMATTPLAILASFAIAWVPKRLWTQVV